MSRAKQIKTTKEASENLIRHYPKIDALSRDPRGLPVPANVFRDPRTSKPNLAVIDRDREIELVCSGLCAVTGTKLDRNDVWFVTIPVHALSPFGMCMDAPVCGGAKDFVLQVCPHFLVPNYQALTKEQKDAITGGAGVDPGRAHTQAPYFVAMRVTGFQILPTPKGPRYVPNRNYTRIEFWKNGSYQKSAERADVRDVIDEYRIKNKREVPAKHLWPDIFKDADSGFATGRWPWDVPDIQAKIMREIKDAMNG